MYQLKLKQVIMACTLTLLHFCAVAQDSSMMATNTTSSSSTTTEQWYMQPWAWIVGGIIVLIILISMFRGKGSSAQTDRVTVTKTVRTESDRD